MKKLKKSEVKEIVWSVWYSYESPDDEFPEWGSCIEDDQVTNRQRVKEIILSKMDLEEDTVQSFLGSVEHFRESVCYDEREVNEEVKDWTKMLHGAQGKKTSPGKVEFLRREVNRMVDEIPPETYLLGHEGRQWMQLLSSRTGVPEEDCRGLLHWCKISRLDEPHREERVKILENELKEHSIHVPDDLV